MVVELDQFDSCYDLLPDGTKPLPEQILPTVWTHFSEISREIQHFSFKENSF